MGKRIARAVGLVLDAIANGKILVADDQLNHDRVSCGKYHTAVQSAQHFAVIGRKVDIKDDNAYMAAIHFVGRVGTTRAVAAARAA